MGPKIQEILEAIYSEAWHQAVNRNQVIGAKMDLYITLNDLMEILNKFREKVPTGYCGSQVIEKVKGRK